MSRDDLQSGVEVLGKIRTKTQACGRDGMARKFRQERGLDQSVLVMATLRPGVGKEHKRVREFGRRGESGEELQGFRAEENEVMQSRAPAFFFGPFETVQDDIYANAKLLGVRSGVGIEVVAVTAADFQGDPVVLAQNVGDLFVQGGAAFRGSREMRERASWVFHAGWLAAPRRGWQLKRAQSAVVAAKREREVEGGPLP